MSGETRKRSIVKTVSYRVMIVLLNAALVYAVTGNWDIMLGFTYLSAFLNTLLYFANERVWNQIHWGRKTMSV